MNAKIACVIVTFNRKNLLLNCIKGVLSQSYKPLSIYIVDNASTDGTYDLLKQNSLVDTQINSITIVYHRLPANVGGAGGFHEGMKLAFETGLYNGIWVMDDDGCPDSDCLSSLIEYFNQYSYLAPLVIDINDNKHLSFPYLLEKDLDAVIAKSGETGLIHNFSSPFNGILFKCDLVSQIGFPRKDMFIWGDEHEYDVRAKHYGFVPVTVVKAIHRHPRERMDMHRDILGRLSIIFTSSSLRNYCKYRNTLYTFKEYGAYSRIIKFLLLYTAFFVFHRNFDWKNLKLLFAAAKEGLFNKEFVNHFNFINK